MIADGHLKTFKTNAIESHSCHLCSRDLAGCVCSSLSSLPKMIVDKEKNKSLKGYPDLE